MKRPDREPVTRRAIFLVAILFLPACTASCTPEEQQEIAQAVFSAIVQAVTQSLDVAASFAQSALAAYWF